MAVQDPSEAIVRRTRNRYRLIALFVIYPIYKAVQFISEKNWIYGAIMGVIALIYLGLVIKLLSSQI